MKTGASLRNVCVCVYECVCVYVSVCTCVIYIQTNHIALIFFRFWHWLIGTLSQDLSDEHRGSAD